MLKLELSNKPPLHVSNYHKTTICSESDIKIKA